MSSPARLPAGVETIRLRRISTDFAFAEVRLPRLQLCNIAVRRLDHGGLRVTAPSTPDRDGKPRPPFHLQPGPCELVEAAIGQACAASEVSP